METLTLILVAIAFIAACAAWGYFAANNPIASLLIVIFSLISGE